MKGTSFQKPFEFNLLVDGESWKQGDAIEGTLVTRSHAGEAMTLDGVKVSLAYGQLSQVKAKNPEAFEILGTVAMPAGKSLAPRAEERLSWRFELDRNAPVTEKGSSLFLLYGSADSSEKLGQLQLPIHPFPLIQDLIELIRVEFRFVVKHLRAAKGGWTEVKLVPPSAQALAFLEYLQVYAKMAGDRLKLRYAFSVKKLDASAGVHLKKGKREWEQELGPEDYRVASGRLNHERLKAAVQDVLTQLTSGPLIPQ